MPTCCVPNCKKRPKLGEKIYMAKLPSDANRKDTWLRNIGRENWTPPKRAFVCEFHFSEKMWEKQREDGSRKLKWSAVPTIINNVVETFTEEGVGNAEETNSSLSEARIEIEELNIMLEAAMRTIEEQLQQLKQNEANNAIINSLRKMIFKQERCNKLLREENRVLNNKIKKMEKSRPRSITAIKKLLNDDQLQFLTTSSHPQKWSDDTIKKAMRLKLLCGTAGYQELQMQNIPLPSTRTLRRKIGSKLSQEGALDDAFKLLEQDVQCLTPEKDCCLVPDGNSVAD